MRLRAITDDMLEEAVRDQEADDFDSHDLIFWISHNRPRPYVQDLYLAWQDDGDPFGNLHTAIGRRLAALPQLVEQQHEKRTSRNVRGERTECEVWRRIGPGNSGGFSPRLRVLRETLVDVARRRDVTFYRPVADLLGIVTDRLDHCSELFGTLDEASTYEHEQGRPLLSVVVVHKEGDRRPGDGFFKMARRNGVQRPDEDDDAFFVAELSRAHDYWAAASTGE